MTKILKKINGISYASSLSIFYFRFFFLLEITICIPKQGRNPPRTHSQKNKCLFMLDLFVISHNRNFLICNDYNNVLKVYCTIYG